MNAVPNNIVHAKLRLELTSSVTGETRIYELENLRAGDRIRYYDDKSGDGRQTEINLGEYTEIIPSNDPLAISQLSRPGRTFFELNLLAEILPYETPQGPTAMRVIDPALYHELVEVHICRPTFATYLCTCGTKGTATVAGHLVKQISLDSRARKNHELHAVRARIRAEKEAKRVQA